MPAVEYGYPGEGAEARAAPGGAPGLGSTAKDQPAVLRAPSSSPPSSMLASDDAGASTPGSDPPGAACDWFALLGEPGWRAAAAQGAAQSADSADGAEPQLLSARREPKVLHDSFRSLAGVAALRAAGAAGAAGAPGPGERDAAAGCDADADTPRRAPCGGDQSPAKRLGVGTPRRGDQLRRRSQQQAQQQQQHQQLFDQPLTQLSSRHSSQQHQQQQQEQQPQQDSQLDQQPQIVRQTQQQACQQQRPDATGSDDLDRASSEETGDGDDVEEGLAALDAHQQQQQSPQPQRQQCRHRHDPAAHERRPLLPQPPCAGRYAAGVRYFTDPSPPRVLPRVGWELLGIASLVGYMALPLHLGIILVCALTFSWPAVFVLTAIVGSLALPAQPLMWAPFLDFALLRSIRTYFDFSFTLDDPAVLDEHVIWAEYPHGVYPLSQLLAVSLNPTQWPGFRLHTVGASVLFKVPLWKHLLGWMGVRPATRREFGALLERGPVKVNPGGIAEMYLLDRCAEVIKIRDRKGFVRLAVQHGTPLLPVYHFGLSRMLNYGPKCLELLSRRMRMSLGIILGRWGLPLPFKVKLHMVVGSPVPVRRLPRDHPEFAAAVDEAHAAYMQALAALYSRHAAAYGWADRPLVMV